MPKGLTETTIDIPLGGSKTEGGGLNQGVDNLLVQPPYLAELVNGDLLIDGSVRRRWPANELPDDGISTRAHQNMNSVFNHDGTALVVNTNLGPHVYTPGTGWSDTGEFGQPPCEIGSRVVGACSSYYVDSVVSDGLVAYVQLEPDGLYFMAFEQATGAVACPRQRLLPGTFYNPKIFAQPTTGYFNVLVMDGTAGADLTIMQVRATNFPALSVTLATSISSDATQYDVAIGDAGILYVAYAEETSGNITARRLVESTFATTTQTFASVNGRDGLGIWFNPIAARLYVIGLDVATDAADAHSGWCSATLATQTTGPTFTMLPSTIPTVGIITPEFTNFTATFGYDGDNGTGMFLAFSTVVRKKNSSSPGQVGTLEQHGCTQSYLVDSSLMVQETLRPAWNYILATKAWNDGGLASARACVGLVYDYIYGTSTKLGVADDDWSHRYIESLQQTVLVCSFGELAHTDTEGHSWALTVVARCHDDVAALALPHTIEYTGISGGNQTARFFSRLCWVSRDGVDIRWARAVYASFASVNPSVTTSGDYPYWGLNGQYGFISQVSMQLQCSPRRTESASNLSQTAAGYLGYFDGQGSFENTPHSYPVDVVVAAPSPPPAGTTLVSGTSAIVWAWQDGRGNLHRSAPANGVLTILKSDTGAGGLAFDFTGHLTDMPLSAIENAPSPRFIEVYVTGEEGIDDNLRLAATIVYDPATTTPRDTSEPWMLDLSFGGTSLAPAGTAFNDSAALLYTSGGVLEALPPPAFIDVTSTRDRLWGLMASSVYFSKALEPGIAPEFNGNLSIPMLTGTGDCVAIVAMDEKVIVFKQSDIFVISGEGPNNTGGGNAFGTPQPVSTDVGCINRASVVRGPFGVVFQGLDGIYLLDRGLNLSWIGKPVINDVTLGMRLTGVLVPQQSHVRWILDDTGRMVVWNYEQNQWSVYEGLTEKHGVPYSTGWVGLLDGVTLQDESVCYFTQERPTAPDEAANYVQATMPLSFTTAWIKTAGIQGFVRVKRALLLGPLGTIPSFFDAHNGLEVKVQYNYIETDRSTYTWTDVDLNPRPQHEMHLEYQKCESLRFLVREIPAADGALTCPGTSFSGISLRVGTKGVPFKYFPQSQVR